MGRNSPTMILRSKTQANFKIRTGDLQLQEIVIYWIEKEAENPSFLPISANNFIVHTKKIIVIFCSQWHKSFHIYLKLDCTKQPHANTGARSGGIIVVSAECAHYVKKTKMVVFATYEKYAVFEEKKQTNIGTIWPSRCKAHRCLRNWNRDYT